MKNQEKKKRKLPGFYIALCACVLMIGIAGYVTQTHTDETKTVVSTSENNSKEAKPVFSDELSDDMSLSLAAITPEPAATPVPTPVPTEAPKAEEKTGKVMDYTADNPDTEGGAIMVTNDLPAFIMPVSGQVLEPYSDKLVYNATLGDWRAHGGIDIAADKGCSVQSVAQGVVERVYDNAMGSCVEISHPAGFVTVYMGLETTENLKEGQEVKSGDVIGTTGDCRGENVTVPHLHFEMYKDKVAVNPSDYLPH